MYTRIFTWHVHGLVRIRLQDPSVHHTHDNMYAYTRLQDTITNKSECISIRDRRKKVRGRAIFCVFRSRAPSGNCAGGGTLTTPSQTAETARPGASMQILNF